MYVVRCEAYQSMLSWRLMHNIAAREVQCKYRSITHPTEPRRDPTISRFPSLASSIFQSICPRFHCSAKHSVAFHLWIAQSPYNAYNNARVAIHARLEAVPTLIKPPTLNPLAAPVFVELVSVAIAVPGILVKLLADAARTSAERRGLFNESHEGRLLSAGIEFVTWIGKSKMVYSFEPFRRKFCLMDIYKPVNI